MGIQDLIGNMGSKSSASPRMPGGLPAYSAKDANNAKLISKELKVIDKLVQSSKANWDKMGQAKALINVQKALEKVKKAEDEFNEAMMDSNASLEKRAALYEKMAKAKNDQVKTQSDENKRSNEQTMMGRAKNVLKDMAKNWRTLGAGIVLKVATKGLKDAVVSFDILAESSQLNNITFAEMAKTTAMYSVQLNLASVKAAQFGVSTEASTIAFAKLTKVYGGTREAVNELGEGWSDMVQIAKISGIGMEAFTDLATQGMMRLGESMDTTKANAVDISKATANMNERFGKGSANAKEFTNAVTSLAFAQGHYNQSTKLTIDTLAREVNMQLALGRSREAALAIGKENIEMAGKAGIVGVMEFTDDLVAGYERAKQEDLKTGGTAAQEEYLAKNVGSKEKGTDKFGADTAVIEHMLKSGETNLFAMQEMISGSSAFQKEMLLRIKVAAAGGDRSTLIKLGVDDPKKFEAMISRGSLVNEQLATVAGGDSKASEAMIKQLFGDTKTADQKSFIEKAQGADGGFESAADMFEAYYKLADSVTSDLDDPASREESVMSYIADSKGKGWFAGVATLLQKVFGVLGDISLAAAAAGTAIGTVAAGGGIAALLGGGAIAAGVATAATVGLVALVAGGSAAVMYKSFQNIEEKKAKGESFWADKEGEGGFLGSRASSVAASGAAGAAAGAVIGTFIFPGIGTAVGAALGGLIGSKVAMDKDARAPGPEDATDATAVVVDDAKAAKDVVTPPATAPVSDGPVSAKGKNQGDSGGAAVATGVISGKSLILEVTNWDQIYAQSVESAA